MHHTRAAREHVIDEVALSISRHTRTDGTRRLTVLADKGYTGLDVGVLTPTKRRKGVHPHFDGQTRNALLVGARAMAERANAVLVMRWHALGRVTLGPAVVGVIAAAAALVPTVSRRLMARADYGLAREKGLLPTSTALAPAGDWEGDPS